jgi:hypothetical protein
MIASTIGATDSSVPLLLGALCLAILFVGLLRRWQQRTATGRDLTRAQLARLREQREVQQSMEELLGQLEEASDRINAQLDARFAKLEELIAAADERCGRPSGPDPAIPASTLAALEPSPAAPAAEPSKPQSCDGLETRRRRILELADAGTAPAAIADALHAPIGEIELMLNLHSFEQRGARPAQLLHIA